MVHVLPAPKPIAPPVYHVSLEEAVAPALFPVNIHLSIVEDMVPEVETKPIAPPPPELSRRLS